MRTALTLAVCFGLLAAGSAGAQQKAIRYAAMHPLSPKAGEGFCYIDAPHVHDHGPWDKRLYRLVDDEYLFVGDPVPFRYEGETYSYYGPHPIIQVNITLVAPIYCYLDGPHYHAAEPPRSAQFENVGGAYWYVGTFEPAFKQESARYVVINDAYRPLVYERPVVDVSLAPPAFKINVNIHLPSVRVGPIILPHPPHPGPCDHPHHHHGHGHGHGKHKHKHKH